jgi:type I restriction enzyme S subunit
MREGWERRKIADIVEPVATIDPRKKPAEEFTYIDVSAVSRATHEIVETSRIKGKDAPSRARRLVRAGDVIFATIRPTLQRIAEMPPELDGAVCSTGYFALRPKPNVLTRFLFYSLFAEHFSKEIAGLQRGAAYPAVSDGDVKAREILVPPLPEQKRIVAILDEAFAGIATAVANTEKNLANARELFESYLNSVFSQRGEGCTKYLLSDVCEFENGDRGKNYPNKSVLVARGIPFVNAGHLVDGKVSLSAISYIPEERFHRLSNGKFSAGDILFCLRGSLGKFGVVGPEVGKGAIASSLVIVRPRTDRGIRSLRRDYLVHYFRSDACSEMIKKYAGGAAQPNLGARDLARFEIFLPSLDQQERQSARLNELLDDTSRLENIIVRKLSSLAELKQSLLQKAFAGELTAAPQDEIETALA